jgi:hypothetical protein
MHLAEWEERISARDDDETRISIIDQVFAEPEVAQMAAFEDIVDLANQESSKSVIRADGSEFNAEHHYEEELRRAVCARRAATFLDGWAVIMPQRIVNEELGDYIEDINRRAGEGQRWRVAVRVLAAMFWTGVNAIGYFLKQIGKQKAA